MEFTKRDRELFARMGQEGGKKRAANMTRAERQAQARKAIQARWDRYRAAQAKASAKRRKSK